MKNILNNIAKQLLPITNDEQQALFEGWLLLEKVTGKGRVALLAHNQQLTDQQQQELELLVADRVEKNKPLAYILGNVPFANLSLIVRPPTLIPRPETEEMVLWIIEQFKDVANQPMRVFDACTGSGCIALALAAAFSAWQVVGIDISTEALALAEENRQALNLHNVSFQQQSLFEDGPWLQPFDLIVSNPPYIDRKSRHLVGDDVLAWEDERALFADDEGWAFYDRLTQLAGQVIRKSDSKKPTLIVEFGVDQHNMEQFLLNRCSASVRIYCDNAGRKRWAAAQI